MISPIEQIVSHLEEIDLSIKEISNTGKGTDDEKMFCLLMQAKSTVLLALVQAEANVLQKPTITEQIFGPNVRLGRD